MPVSKWLIIVGLVLVAAGLLWPLMSKLGLGRLPGDIVVRRDGFSLYFPLMTSLVISMVVSIVIWIFRR
jgi:formate hydrogenlyase subunit 3/multisubunit Na+/H+ antiporter MnhD subunit